MLGENIMMAPAFGANLTEVEMFLPGPENWLNLWTKEWTNITDEGQTISANCTLGYPAVYMRSTDGFNAMDYADILNPSDIPEPANDDSNTKTIILATCIPALLILLSLVAYCACKGSGKTSQEGLEGMKEKLEPQLGLANASHGE
jgi:hypothetical protein